MKLHGIKLEGAARKTIVFPRETGNLVFVFQAILNSEEFDKLFPQPTPPVKKMADGQKIREIKDPNYLKLQQSWAENKAHWMFLQSIAATPELEWETVDSQNPETWKNYETELISAGLTESERLKMLQAYIEVQGLDDEKIKAATNSFLAGLQEASNKELSQSSEVSDMPFGEDANA
jgi:hypothetical protein